MNSSLCRTSFVILVMATFTPCMGLAAAEDPKDPKSAETKAVPAPTPAPLTPGEAPKEAKPADPQTVQASTLLPINAPRETYSNPLAGYSVLLPAGYRKLTDDETREVFKGLSDYISKDVAERARKQPPTWFVGPLNPKAPNDHPPSLAIAFTENPEQIDPAQIPVYRDMLEEKHKREGDKVGDVVLSVVKVDGISSLQEENDMINPINNERNRLIRVAIPGKGKWFELVFNYSTDQNDAVRAALKDTLESFKVMEHPPENIENTKKWLRVLAYTIGFGLGGVLLSFLFRKLSRSND